MSTYVDEFARVVSVVSEQRTSPELQTIFQPIRADLDRVEDLLVQAAQTSVPELSEAIDSLVRGRGKRIRPALTIFAAQFHQTKLNDVHHLAVAAEMLHVATLIHDDLIDRATVRRGEKTLSARWSGTATVLAGDYLLAKAGRVAADIENFSVFKLFAEAVMTICEGEIRQDFNGDHAPTDRANYFDHIYSKTAALFMACTEGGALLSGANAEQMHALREYGRLLGLAFQIIDDTLDFVGTTREIGKPVGSDLREGIITLPAIYFLERDPRAAEAKHILFENGQDPQQIERVVEMIRTSPAIRSSQDEARALVHQAQAMLDNLPDTVYRQSLYDLADFVVERNR